MPVDPTSTPRIPRRALGRFKWFALLIPFSAALLLYVDLENRRERSSCRAHMNAIAVALAKYELENPALAPERWHEYIVMEGLISAETLRCPADDLSDDSISYDVMLPFVSRSRIPPVYIREIRPNHGGRSHRLYADGHFILARPEVEEASP